MRRWAIWVCGCACVALLSSVEAEHKEHLLHLPGTVLLGYPGGEELYITRNKEELTIQPPGSRRAGHHTYPSLSRNGTLVATSYVKTPYPNYREGVATYSLIDKQWKLYDGDFAYVWAVALSPDASTLAFKAERHDWKLPRQLLLMDLKSGETRVLMESFLGSAPVTWSPDGTRIAYEQEVPPPDPKTGVNRSEVRTRDLRTQQETKLADGTTPSWSPSGEWIAYRHSGAYLIVHPDGTGTTELVKQRRNFPWFTVQRFVYPAVWSRDSKTFLLNSPLDDETARMFIHLFDIDSRTLQRKTGKGVAALGWTQ